jgi:hypothetical protein
MYVKELRGCDQTNDFLAVEARRRVSWEVRTSTYKEVKLSP